MYTFQQSTGAFSQDGVQLGMGYSGIGAGLDNVSEQAVQGIGPIPQGLWYIGPAVTHLKLGPLTMALTPDTSTDVLGRSGFYIHGDNASVNHTASHGCVVLSYNLRAQVASNSDKQLTVIP